jgi:hypothetical protein
MVDPERIQAAGYLVTPTGTTQIVLDLVGSDEWLYCERTAGAVKLWSGPACKKCQPQLTGLTRCQAHRELSMVALQIKVKGW